MHMYNLDENKNSHTQKIMLAALQSWLEGAGVKSGEPVKG